MLLALVLGVVGLVGGGRRGAVLIGCALVLGSLAGLEVAIREHVAGYRSHATVLAAAIGVAAGTGLFVAGLPPWLVLVVAVGLFGASFWALRGAFRRRGGG